MQEREKEPTVLSLSLCCNDGRVIAGRDPSMESPNVSSGPGPGARLYYMGVKLFFEYGPGSRHASFLG